MAGKRTKSTLAKKILKMIEDAGYTIREAKNCLEDRGWRNGVDWNCSEPKRGIRMAVTQKNHGGVDVRIKARTDINTYKQWGDIRVGTDRGNTFYQYSHYCPEQGYQHVNSTESELEQWIAGLRGEEPTRQLRSKADLAPLNFRNSQMDVNDSGRVIVHHFTKWVECKDIVAINDKLQVSQEGITTPGEECWFLVEGCEVGGNRFNLIINADMTRFHVITFRRTQRFEGWQVTHNHKPDNGRIDFTHLTVLDQQAISLAIETYITKNNIAA